MEPVPSSGKRGEVEMELGTVMAGIGVFLGLFTAFLLVTELAREGATRMWRRLRTWGRDEHGTTSIEYALMLAVVAVSLFSVLGALHQSLSTGVHAQTQAIGAAGRAGGGPESWHSWR